MSARRTVAIPATFPLPSLALLARFSLLARPLVLAALMILVTLAAAACGNSSPAAAASPAGTESSPATASAPVPRATGASIAPGGPVAPVAPVSGGQARCAGWPSAPAGRLPRGFQAASVLRCLTETVSVPGKGEWTAAVLEKASQDLAPLTGALSAVSGHREPGHMCPEYLIAPPQIVLVSKDGAMIRPVFPVTACGQIQPKVLSALAALRWQAVSRRLLAKAPA